MQIAIITGASSGLGRQCTAYADRQGLDEIWLLARRRDRLEEVAAGLTTQARVIALDLTEEASWNELDELIQAARPDIACVIHAAGFGRIGPTADLTTQGQLAMIRIHCEASLALTKSVVPYMQRGARLVFISSVAAFLPIPYFNVYAAAKAFLLRYSRALRQELQPRGISVTAVCPYWVGDTEFVSAARQEGGSRYFPRLFLPSKSAAVMQEVWRDIEARRELSVPGWQAKLIRLASGLLPQRVMLLFCRLFA